MGINNVNSGSPVVWSSLDTPVRRGEEIDFSKAPALSNRDRFVLNLPSSETIYKRQEFVTDESMAEGCAYCYTYMERVMEFGSGARLISSSNDGYFVINTDKDDRTFGKSGADMDDIAHAVEETWERIERSLEQFGISGGLSGSFTKNGHTVGGSFGFDIQGTIYRQLSVSETKGSVSYKDGAAGVYREKAISYREIYNMCASFLAEAFGEKSTELHDAPLDKLREFIEKHLSGVRQNDPDCGSLKAFEDTYSKLKEYDLTDIASFMEKMFAE